MAAAYVKKRATEKENFPMANEIYDFGTDPSTVLEVLNPIEEGLKCGTISVGHLNWLYKCISETLGKHQALTVGCSVDGFSVQYDGVEVTGLTYAEMAALSGLKSITEAGVAVTLDSSHAGKIVSITTPNAIVEVPTDLNDPITGCNESTSPLIILNASGGDIAVRRDGTTNYFSVTGSRVVMDGDAIYFPAGASSSRFLYVGTRVTAVKTYLVDPATTSPFEYVTVNTALQDMGTRNVGRSEQTIALADGVTVATASFVGAPENIIFDGNMAGGASVSGLVFVSDCLSISITDLEASSIRVTNASHLVISDNVLLGGPDFDNYAIFAVDGAKIHGGTITIKDNFTATGDGAGVVMAIGDGSEISAQLLFGSNVRGNNLVLSDSGASIKVSAGSVITGIATSAAVIEAGEFSTITMLETWVIAQVTDMSGAHGLCVAIGDGNIYFRVDPITTVPNFVQGSSAGQTAFYAQAHSDIISASSNVTIGANISTVSSPVFNVVGNTFSRIS